jgi:hypothetical protein
MNKIIQYINENEIEDMVRAVLDHGKDIEDVIQKIKQSRVEYQRKSQFLQWELEKHLHKGCE